MIQMDDAPTTPLLMLPASKPSRRRPVLFGVAVSLAGAVVLVSGWWVAAVAADRVEPVHGVPAPVLAAPTSVPAPLLVPEPPPTTAEGVAPARAGVVTVERVVTRGPVVVEVGAGAPPTTAARPVPPAPVVPLPVVVPDPVPTVETKPRPVVHWSAPCTPAGVPVIDGYGVSDIAPEGPDFPYGSTYVFDGCESMDAVRTDIPD